MKTIEELKNYIQAKAANSRLYVIAVSGFGGAGKSTISKELAEQLADTTLILIR